MSKGLFYTLLMFALAYLFSCCQREVMPPPPVNNGFVEILKCNVDGRYLYSVIFIDERGDTVGLDYLNQAEFDSLVRTMK